MADLDTELREGPETQVSLSAAEGDTVKRRTRLWLMIVVHVVLGIFFCTWAALEERLAVADLLVVPVAGLVLAKSSLLGFWTVFSPMTRSVRLAGLIAGTTYLESLFSFGVQSGEIVWLVVMSTGGITTVFGLIRWRYAELRRFPQTAAQADQEGLKFSIRGLMLFTFLVAITMVGVKELRERETPQTTLLLISVWSLCYVVIGLAGVWSGLGLARPTLRSVVVLLVSAVLGAALTYGVSQDRWESYLYIISMMLIHAGVLIGSLLVVRSCGYRLMRKSMPDVEPAD